MSHIQTEVLVIGGGATGTGILRDLALRGFRAILVEKRDLSHGTTGRYHGLLHSGARYAVKDPPAARECIAENRILRRIMPGCLEDTGGFYVLTPYDDPAYADRFVAGCRQAGIPVEEVATSAMLRVEPLLNPAISRCFQVPDASADSFLAAEWNAANAKSTGAQVLTYHEVLRLLVNDSMPGARRVSGALCRNLVNGEEVAIHADLVINAAGAWVGKIAATIGVPVKILPGKGVMVAANQRVVNTVISRCKLPADGDILVPIHSVAIIGTTDIQVPDPDRFSVEPWEIQLMLAEGEKLVPGFKNLRMLRCWAGVRPLYQETRVTASRDISRAFVLLDHAARDGVEGLLTITSGKWTTYRLMAQAAVDLACEKLGTKRPCRTASEPLEAPKGKIHSGYHRLSEPLEKLEKTKEYGSPVCECELATYSEIVSAIVEKGAQTLDDIRRDARLGMGPCQGGFCSYRAAGIWQALRNLPAEKINVALRDFLQERWKGLLPVLWGQQLRQERLAELIYISNLNVDHLPGAAASELAASNYLPGNPLPAATSGMAGKMTNTVALHPPPEVQMPTMPTPRQVDVIVIGAGFAGLATAWRAAAAGLQVQLLTKGWGATHWQSGCIDVLGYLPTGEAAPWKFVECPADALAQIIQSNPQHPYALCGMEQIAAALQALIKESVTAGYPLHGSLESNWLLPTSLGSMRPTCLAPASMTAGDLRRTEPMLLIGFEGYRDFFPGLAAANLEAQGQLARGEWIDLPQLNERHYTFTITLARLFDSAEFRASVAAAVKPRLGRAARVGFPAVLGLENPLEAWRDLQEQLGCPVFELPGLPPSIGGIRLHQLLVNAITRSGGRVWNGLTAIGAEITSDPEPRVELVWTEAAARLKPNRARAFVLASGGILGGGLQINQTGAVRELVFNLMTVAQPPPSEFFKSEFLHPQGHPIYRTGLSVDSDFRPLNISGHPALVNLYAAGAILAHAEPIRERSLDGLALVTGYTVGERLAQ